MSPTFHVDPFPVLLAGSGKAYGSLASTRPEMAGVPVPLVTEASPVSVHRPKE